ncbi:divalent-cation tolerance protein CutA [Amycolatopsis rhabdoformis]|uniref:Divalent-cation tolerance protein CutA n=1 Tax=Amycolatopsis rhabdoformis TaxID=1448059 RepID=A0ABZ1IJE4_9PSEU|nr:divalent-cation tolerance protein CutA [Amycolatopsis rhabdoformis]WSE33956.1 divalent-cation tolerance protein CutA [Amycolatopsis rhabdoformis]
MADHLIVMTTTPDRESADRIASSAVARRLAATAQVRGPVASYFWHLGEAGQGEEWVVTFKTTGARYDDLETHIRAEHPWDKPEVTGIELSRGSADYLRWLDTATTPEN